MVNLLILLFSIVALTASTVMWYKSGDRNWRVVVIQAAVITLYNVWAYSGFKFINVSSPILGVLRFVAAIFVLWVGYRFFRNLWKAEAESKKYSTRGYDQ
jgi:uncharacterized membrane protein YfcA